MRGLQFIPPTTTLNFVGRRYITFAMAAAIVVGTLVLLLVRGLNYGIDFKGGILMEVKAPQAVKLDVLRRDLSTLDLGEITLQDFGSPDDVLIRIERQPGGDESQQHAVTKVQSMLAKSLGKDVSLRRVETVGPKVGQELIKNGCLALIFSLLAMFLYVWIRYEWQFGVSAIVALFHDAIAVVGFYALFWADFNTTALVALLITIGYSINDTVVVYDRIRENMRKFKVTDMGEVINMSINETLSRTVLTSGTTLLSLMALYIFGGEIIASYTLPIIVGVTMGTFSSICLAAPMLLLLPKIRRPSKDATQGAKG